MGRFLREYWLWIAAPLVLILAAVIAVLLLGGSGEDPLFDYDIN